MPSRGGVITLRTVGMWFYVLSSLTLLAEQHLETRPSAAHPKAAWLWSLEERIAVRLDPDHLSHRARAYREALRAGPSAGAISPAADSGPGFVIQGGRNPELFIPTELFDSVLRGFSDDKAIANRVRESYRQRITAFGWDADRFWSRLQPIVADYLRAGADAASVAGDLQVARNTEERRRLARDLAAAEQKVCRERASALRAANAAYDHDEFARFLYEVVAPSLNVFAHGAGEHEADELRRAEGGCR